MPPRASSPALSENEFDISNALIGSNEDGDKSRRDHLDIGVELEDGSGSDDETFIAAQQAASNRKASNLKGKTVKKGGGFQAMGLNAALLKAITRKGFSIPTPIQRKAIPLILDNQDVVGMARTGSGKTAAFVIPLIERLKAHSVKVGARGIIMSPSRELALQTLKVVKELARGTDLRTVLLVGGDGLEDQFSSMTTNPDIIIATPGRFLHLKVEMGLDLSSARYIVFDEADRLFEMGFASQLAEILHDLPAHRQTLLFSATLPKSLVEFARAGLSEPKLIRLDAETKISPDLESAFFTVKSAERDGALLSLLEDIIKIPPGRTEVGTNGKGSELNKGKKRKRNGEVSNGSDSPTAHSTIIFAATKHRVEYLVALLKASMFSVAYAYGNLDQTARKQQIQAFRDGEANILVVTDVAGRGIDLPALANVVNYDLCSQPKIFVHRVGRTARAGRKGWSYSLVRDSDLPYLIDLQLFLGRRLVLNQQGEKNFAQDMIVGGFAASQLEPSLEYVSKLLAEDEDLAALQSVAEKGEAQYTRTRNSASNESVKRSREMLASRSLSGVLPLFGGEVSNVQIEREAMLAKLSSFRPAETVFEIGKRSSGGEVAEAVRKRREQMESRRHRVNEEIPSESLGVHHVSTGVDDSDSDGSLPVAFVEGGSEFEDMEVSLSQPTSRNDTTTDFRSEYYLDYVPKNSNLAEDRGYGVHSGSYNTAQQNSNFVEAARGVTMDLAQDDTRGFGEPTKARGLRWDKKNKKYVARANDEDGSKGVKMVRGESGLKIAASFRSGRFDAWRKSNKIDRLPRTGEMEASNRSAPHAKGRHFKHKLERAPKDADRFRDDYHIQKKRVEEAKQKRIGKFKDGGGKSELKGIDDVRKQRKIKDKRKEKNARPSKKRTK